MNPDLINYIEQRHPESLLECSSSPWPELEQFCREQQIPFYAVAPHDLCHLSQTADLAIVHDTLEVVAQPEAQQILGYLRNSLAQRIWLILTDGTGWPLPALLALGFKRDDNFPLAHAGSRAYSYDISSYNHKRSWNNPRFWANPENFKKYRW